MHTTLTDENFREEVIDNRGVVLVEIGADWCGTCHMMAPILEQLARDFGGRLKVGKLDIDANAAMARRYGINTLPILLFFKDGQIRDHVVGAVPSKEMIDKLSPLFGDADFLQEG